MLHGSIVPTGTARGLLPNRPRRRVQRSGIIGYRFDRVEHGSAQRPPANAPPPLLPTLLPSSHNPSWQKWPCSPQAQHSRDPLPTVPKYSAASPSWYSARMSPDIHRARPGVFQRIPVGHEIPDLVADPSAGRLGVNTMAYVRHPWCFPGASACRRQSSPSRKRIPRGPGRRRPPELTTPQLLCLFALPGDITRMSLSDPSPESTD